MGLSLQAASTSPSPPTTRVACQSKTCFHQARRFVSAMFDGRTRTHFIVHVLREVLAVDITTRGGGLYPEGCVADLGGQTVFKVEKACLADVLNLCASLANHRGLEAHSRSRVPAKDSERTCTGPARSPKFLLRLFRVSRGLAMSTCNIPCE